MTHSSEVGTAANVPAFLTKLWKLVEDPNYDHLIHWSQNGKSFIISNQAQFSKELLPLYFKHNNMASFIRQLNMYGFRKLTNIEHSGLRSERDDIEFYHVHFVKDQESSLELIKRKIKTPLQVSATKSVDENEVRHDDVGSILVDVKAIKGKQDTVDNILVNMQKENEALWREIAILRRKYQKQQHIVEKLLQFLLSLVQQRGIGVKRKSPLMIGLNETSDSDGEFSKSKRLAKDDQMDTLNSSLGPLIFDVSDDIIEEELEATANNCPIIATAELSPLCISKSDSPVENILNSDQIVDSNDAVEALLNPIQSVIDSSIMAPDIDETVQLNGNSNLMDDSVTSIAVDEALFNPAIQSVIDSSLASNRGATLEFDGTNKSSSPIPSTSTSASCTSTTPSNTTIDHPIMSLDSTDDNVVALLDPLQSVIESSIMQPTTDLTSTSNVFKNELTQSNADAMIEQSMASMGNDDGNVEALLGSLQSLPLSIFDFESITNNFV